MRPRMVIAIVACIGVLFSLVLFARSGRTPVSSSANSPSTAPKTADQIKHSKIIAYYFHGTVRCMTCRKIESLSHDVVAADFAAQLKTGDLEWQVVNVDLPENQHFITDYQLVTKSLVLVSYENGKPTGYKNLQDIWRLVNKEEAFRNYVKGELQAAIGKG
jgi:hypothetical protein